MSLNLSTPANLSKVYKMDNVLYEVRDRNGLLQDQHYEQWKAEILGDLKKSGFIEAREDLYVLTEAGKEVIRQDSLLNYDPNKKTEQPKVQEYVLQLNEYSQFQNPLFLGGLVLVFIMVFGMASLI